MANDITTRTDAADDDASGRWRSDSETIERRDREHVEVVTNAEPAEQDQQNHRRAPLEPAVSEARQ